MQNFIKISELMLKAGVFTLKDYSKIVDINARQLGKLRNGRVKPSISTLIKLYTRTPNVNSWDDVIAKPESTEKK